MVFENLGWAGHIAGFALFAFPVHNSVVCQCHSFYLTDEETQKQVEICLRLDG